MTEESPCGEQCIVCKSLIGELFWKRTIEVVDKSTLSSRLITVYLCDECGPELP